MGITPNNHKSLFNTRSALPLATAGTQEFPRSELARLSTYKKKAMSEELPINSYAQQII